MPPVYRTIPALLGGLVLIASALVVTALATPRQAPATRPVFVKSCLGYCRHPTNAGKVFRWGHEAWRQEFETGHLGSAWRSNHRRLIGQQQGMLTIRAGSRPTTVKVWPAHQSARLGRWEARIRPYEHSRRGARYQLTWELVPAHGDERCGANAIVLARYQPGDKRVTGSVRTPPDSSFTYSRARDLRNRAWHTYAIEITKRHISWFVDTQVVRTERRPAALSGTSYRPQLVLAPTHRAKMRPTWLQADWVRYYTLKRHNARSIKAPKMHKARYLHGC